MVLLYVTMNNHQAPLILYPNSGNFNVDFALDKASVGFIEIRNVSGKLVKRIAINSKILTTAVQLDNLESGVYFCAVVVDGQLIETAKVVLLP